MAAEILSDASQCMNSDRKTDTGPEAVVCVERAIRIIELPKFGFDS
jgi:hypothetical protein